MSSMTANGVLSSPKSITAIPVGLVSGVIAFWLGNQMFLWISGSSLVWMRVAASMLLLGLVAALVYLAGHAISAAAACAAALLLLMAVGLSTEVSPVAGNVLLDTGNLLGYGAWTPLPTVLLGALLGGVLLRRRSSIATASRIHNS